MTITTVGVPSGIGDVSWLYSKLSNIGPLDYKIADGWPYRTKQFLELLPYVRTAEYAPFTYRDIMNFEQIQNIGFHPTWKDVRSRGFEECLIEANRHLELGKPLKDWMPDLPTNYHYEIPVPAEDVERAIALLRGMNLKKPIWGISAASYRGSEAWKTWGYAEWSRFLKMFLAEADGSNLLLGGFWDDLTATLADDGHADVVGKTSIGTAVEILNQISGYIGFSSGLGVIMTVLNRPTFMLWPDHQVELSTSWADPDMLLSGKYATSLWREPVLVYKNARRWLRANYV